MVIFQWLDVPFRSINLKVSNMSPIKGARTFGICLQVVLGMLRVKGIEIRKNKKSDKIAE